MRVFLCVFFVFLQANLFGQPLNPSLSIDKTSPPAELKIRGQIAHPQGSVFSELTVELCDRGGNLVSRTQAQANGDFYFNSVQAGRYEIRIRDAAGSTLAEQPIEAVSGLTEMTVRMPVVAGLLPSDTRIPYAELSHKVLPEALKEGRKSDKALAKHDLKGVIEHLENALKIDPEFLAAHRNLARAYLQVGQFERAIDEFRAVLRVDPRSREDTGGLATAHLGLNRFHEAEETARRVLAMDPSSEVGHLVLGCSLAGQRKGDAEALEHLRRIADRVPKAHVVQAMILARQGQREEARTHLKTYFESGDREVVSEANELLARL